MILHLLERLGWTVLCAHCKRQLPNGKPPAFCHACQHGYVTPDDASRGAALITLGLVYLAGVATPIVIAILWGAWLCATDQSIPHAMGAEYDYTGKHGRT